MEQSKGDLEVHPVLRYVLSVFGAAVEPYGDYFERLHDRVESSAPLGASCGCSS